MIQLLPKISGNFRGGSEVPKFHGAFGIDWKRTILLAIFPSKSVNLGLKLDLHGLFLS